ncbi:glycosyltransferase family 9 protein [Pararcticibacter amylolyticus]|uniref:Heptosyltransferase n=1 Tax=Pararcticibacter amylolyticus TaxID=2173175 RepID=A0A2U2PCH9_9SPHI|nr:glycosyltransferase family 9 protein [Pararcticibacter amylolyticus]PWG79095.1 heptosyltransferase [Pararcticibacter amylolyticus]
MTKFLIIQTAFIGDVVLATALAEKLHQHFPAARIDMMVRKGNEMLLKSHPFLNKVWIWDKKKKKLANLLRLSKEIRKERYDEVINLQRFFSTGLLTALSKADRKRGFDKNPLSSFFDITQKHDMQKDGACHETERNQQLIADLTDGIPARPRLYPTIQDFKKANNLTSSQSYICCAPASVWFTKQYPREHWITFIRNIAPELKVYLLGGPGDKDLCDAIITGSGNPQAENLCGSLSFLESAALMSGAKMNYVNDSAPMHFASAVNAPVTAIYCSTVPGFGFGPLSDKKNIVEIDYPLSCRPCGLHGYKACPQTHFKCAHDIPHQRLIEILNEC